MASGFEDLGGPGPWIMHIQMIQLYRYGAVAAYAVQVFEWLITLASEYRTIHRARWSTVRLAYLLCRYYPLCVFPVVLWAHVGDHSKDTCMAVTRPVHALTLPLNLFPQAVMFIRAYAFSGRRRTALAILSLCFGAIFSVAVWVFCTHTPIPSPELFGMFGGMGCFPDYRKEIMGLRLGMLLLCTMLMDFAAISIVIYQCYTVIDRHQSLAAYFINQGLGSFALISSINIVAAALYYQLNTSMGLVFASMIPNLVACRLILQLREKAQAKLGTLDRSHEHNTLSTLGFKITSNYLRTDVWLTEDDGEYSTETGYATYRGR